MKNANYPAMPQANEEVVAAFLEHEYDAPNGLTKREEFAKAAMQGLLSADVDACMPKADCARIAVEHADALLAELDKE